MKQSDCLETGNEHRMTRTTPTIRPETSRGIGAGVAQSWRLKLS
jgi:hypothetical protein